MTESRLKSALAALDEVLAGPATSFRELRRVLSAALEPLLVDPSPEVGEALAARLESPIAGPPLRGFGGKLQVRPKQIKQWYLLRAIGLIATGGRIPVTMLEAPWRETPNQPEKYFHPLPAALWAVSQLGQRDPATIGALVTRLGAPGEPAWLDGDRVGALSAITGKHFGYDRAAWRRWWATQPGGQGTPR